MAESPKSTTSGGLNSPQITPKSAASDNSAAKNRPDALDCQKNVVVDGVNFLDMTDDSNTGCSSSSATTGTSSSVDNANLVMFVAENLQERLRGESAATSASLSPPAFSGTLANSPYPPLIPDVQAIFEMESEAMRISQHVDRLLEELTGTLHGMSELTVRNVEAYSGAVTKTCNTVDTTIRSMYQLMAKVEELAAKLRPLPRLVQQIKEIKRVLDMFDLHMQKSSGS